MTKDKYKAFWFSHSSINDFLHCPRAYFLRAVYKDPLTGHKITEVKPSLTLGQVVHDVINDISNVPTEERLSVPLKERLEKVWVNVKGKRGGFRTDEEENEYKEKALGMLNRIEKHPGPINKKAIKLKSDGDLPYFWLSEEENIILCGKIDWIEYLEKTDSIHIIDFKTGKNEESESSLQLPIYLLLAQNLQKRKIDKVSYWYLNKSDQPIDMPIPDYEKSFENILEITKRIKLGKQINYFKCPKDGCFFCNPLERIIKGEGELVGESEYHQDIYLLP